MPHLFVGHVFNKEQISELRPAIRKGIPMAGAEVWFADEDPGTGSLFEKLKAAIDAAFACLFEISDGTRPNVFVELGYALGRDKACLLICRRGTPIPTDLKGFELFVEYESYEELSEELKKKIGRILAKSLGGVALSKAVIIALAAKRRPAAPIGRSALVKQVMRQGASKQEVDLTLDYLAHSGIIIVRRDTIKVANRDTLAQW